MKNVLLSIAFLVFSCGLAAQSSVGQEDLRVFPNPVTTQFEIGNSDRVKTIRVINMVGREVKVFDYVSDKPYNVADLPQGMYLVQLQDAEDKVIHTQRVKKN